MQVASCNAPQHTHTQAALTLTCLCASYTLMMSCSGERPTNCSPLDRVHMTCTTPVSAHSNAMLTGSRSDASSSAVSFTVALAFCSASCLPSSKAAMRYGRTRKKRRLQSPKPSQRTACTLSTLSFASSSCVTEYSFLRLSSTHLGQALNQEKARAIICCTSSLSLWRLALHSSLPASAVPCALQAFKLGTMRLSRPVTPFCSPAMVLAPSPPNATFEALCCQHINRAAAYSRVAASSEISTVALSSYETRQDCADLHERELTMDQQRIHDNLGDVLAGAAAVGISQLHRSLGDGGCKRIEQHDNAAHVPMRVHAC